VVTDVLIAELNKNIDWYQLKGRLYKRLSFSIRSAYLVLFAAAAICMAVYGAGAATVILGIIGGAAALIDRQFSVTRNWTEFSYLEVKLRNSVALMSYYSQQGDYDLAVSTFREAVDKVEAETMGWQSDVVQGVAELKALFEKRVNGQPT